MPDLADVVDWAEPPAGFDAIVADLRALRAAANHPSYAELGRRIAQLRSERGVPAEEQRIARSTLYDCFRDGRRRMDADAVTEIALALGLPRSHLTRWRARLQDARSASDGAAIVQVRAAAPPPVQFFTGRQDLLTQLQEHLGRPDARVWISGMPGSGKTQLALALAELVRERAMDTLFVDLRGHQAEAPPAEVDATQRALLQHLGRRAGDTTGDRATQISDALAAGGNVLVLDDSPTPTGSLRSSRTADGQWSPAE